LVNLRYHSKVSNLENKPKKEPAVPHREKMIGLRVAYARKRDGFDQRSFARSLGITKDQLSSIESGRVPLKLVVGWKLCQIMLLDPNWLANGGDDSALFPEFDLENQTKFTAAIEADKRINFSKGWDSLGWILYSDGGKDLTDTQASGTLSAVKPQLPDLVARLKSATEEPGKMTELAKAVGAPLASVSRWLSGKREPGGEATLQMLKWVEHQERQNKKP
jgi:transcriptional regulator with XRE-family HTH domain